MNNKIIILLTSLLYSHVNSMNPLTIPTPPQPSQQKQEIITILNNYYTTLSEHIIAIIRQEAQKLCQPTSEPQQLISTQPLIHAYEAYASCIKNNAHNALLGIDADVIIAQSIIRECILQNTYDSIEEAVLYSFLLLDIYNPNNAVATYHINKVKQIYRQTYHTDLFLPTLTKIVHTIELKREADKKKNTFKTFSTTVFIPLWQKSKALFFAVLSTIKAQNPSTIQALTTEESKEKALDTIQTIAEFSKTRAKIILEKLSTDISNISEDAQTIRKTNSQIQEEILQINKQLQQQPSIMERLLSFTRYNKNKPLQERKDKLLCILILRNKTKNIHIFTTIFNSTLLKKESFPDVKTPRENKGTLPPIVTLEQFLDEPQAALHEEVASTTDMPEQIREQSSPQAIHQNKQSAPSLRPTTNTKQQRTPEDIAQEIAHTIQRRLKQQEEW